MSAFHQLISDWLGVQSIRTEGDVLQIVEQQLPTSMVTRLMKLGLTRQEVHPVIIPLRTLQQRRSKRAKLTLEESDRVLRVVRILSRTEVVFGSREGALDWLRRPMMKLENRAPIALLRTDAGARRVEEILVQIDEGMFI